MNKKINLGWILSILSIMCGGFLLFNIAFVGLALIVNGIGMQGGNQEFDFLSTFIIFLSYSAVFGILMFGLKKLLSKVEFKTILNATFLTLVLMASLVLIGIMFHDNSLLIVIVGLLFMIPILIWMISKKLHYWYLFSWSFVMVLGALIYFFDIQI